MIQTNSKQLVCQSVIGEITSPLGGANPYRINPDGHPAIYPGVGGITYNLRIGDAAGDLFGDHVEPGVSISNFTQFQGQPAPNRALNLFACVGNIAKVVSGEAKGRLGRVTGKHGGIEHILIDFEAEIMEQLVIGDKIQIKAHGCGLQLTDFPGIKTFNIAPELLAVINLQPLDNHRLQVPVTHKIPAKIMGSGIGASHSHSGDYDIQMFDQTTVEKHNLHSLKLGDFVAITNADAGFGRVYKTGGIVIGIVVHASCVMAGHGPGVMSILSSKDGKISPTIDAGANLAKYFSTLESLNTITTNDKNKDCDNG